MRNRPGRAGPISGKGAVQANRKSLACRLFSATCCSTMDGVPIGRYWRLSGHLALARKIPFLAAASPTRIGRIAARGDLERVFHQMLRADVRTHRDHIAAVRTISTQ